MRVATNARTSARTTGTVSRINQGVYKLIEACRNEPIEGKHTYVYLGGLVLKRTLPAQERHVSFLVAVGVEKAGFRTILGICEGATLDKRKLSH